jgi:hypothetical protein
MKTSHNKEKLKESITKKQYCRKYLNVSYTKMMKIDKVRKNPRKNKHH